MQVAERAQIDQDVEDERVAAAVLAQQVVVRAATGDRQIEHLVDSRLVQVVDERLDLADTLWPAASCAIQQRGDDLAQRVARRLGQLDALSRSVGLAKRRQQRLGGCASARCSTAGRIVRTPRRT